MSSTAKIWLALIVIVLIALAAYYFWPSSSAPAYSPPGQAAAGSAGNTAAAGSAAAATLPAGNSDASLNQDTASIDAQMNGLSSDNASLNQSDAPVVQSY